MKRNFEDEYKELVTECAEHARSLANRRAMMGLFDPIHIYIINHRLVPMAGSDVETAWVQNVPMIGTIGPGVPYSDYWRKIYNMAFRSPIWANTSTELRSKP